MREALTWIAAAWLLLVAFSLLALLQDRHRQRVLATCKPASRRRVAAFCATSQMLGSLALCVASQGTAYGILAWSMLASFAALAVALCLAACPVLLRPLLPLGAARPVGDACSTFRSWS
jgi:Protein of unknown function (DUF3325)